MKSALFLLLVFNFLVIQTIATHNHVGKYDSETELEKESVEDDDDIDNEDEEDYDDDDIEEDSQLTENDDDDNEVEHSELEAIDDLYKRGHYYRKRKRKPEAKAEKCDLCHQGFKPVGCYGDKHCSCSRPMTKMLFRTRKCHKKMGSDEFKKHIESVICRCAQESRKRGYKAFGIQDHHECWSGARAHKDYYINGEHERSCINIDRKICNSTKDRLCVGRRDAYYVYKLEPRQPRSVKYSRVGCYADNKENRALKYELDNHRDQYSKLFHGPILDWKKYHHAIETLANHCATKAKAKGYKYFGLQYYGECWSSNEGASRFNIHGASKACINSEFKECDVTKDCLCIGKQFTNFVYKIEE